MSRRSLRLDDGLLDRSLPRSSASFNVGGTSWKSARSRKSIGSRQLSTSCSESILLHTAQNQSRSTQPLLNNSVRSSVPSEASDASLLSSMLNDSCIQESTLMDTFWGLDHDVDPKESTVVAEQSTVLPDRTLNGSEDCCLADPVLALGGKVYCTDRELDSDRKESTDYPFSPSVTKPGVPEAPIYSRERNRKTRPVARSSTFGIMKESVADPRGSAADLRGSGANGSLWKMAADVCRSFKIRWRHMTSSPLQTRFAVGLLPLLLALTILLLSLFAPVFMEWRTTSNNLMSPSSQPAEGSVREEEPFNTEPPPQDQPFVAEEVVVLGSESARLTHLEQSFSALWERVEAGGRKAQQRHEEMLRLYAELDQQSGEVEPWMSGLVEQQLEPIRTQLQEDQQLPDQQTELSRLDLLEQQLESLAHRTEELQRSREAAEVSPSSSPPAAVSPTVDTQSRDALLGEVSRLEAALKDVRQDVDSLAACRGGCRQLDGIQQMISEQVSFRVHEEVQTLVYGNQKMLGVGSPGEVLPESLLQWLSQRYVSDASLQVSMASLELRILQNVSLQLDQHRNQEMDKDAVQRAGAATGATVTQEDVQLIVMNALRLFSQDKTGMADYALESGGGSVLSTRCSRTFETKAALLSLFGLPLWYFSQSPRTVIQPDVHPGNCWAFQGSKGFLVIRLSMRIVLTAVSLEHIPMSLDPSGMLLSAPRDFSVYGLEDEDQDVGLLLGSFSFDKSGESLQTFALTGGVDQAFQLIEVLVLSNWGHPEYTCMYRFRAHGRPQT